MPYSPMESEEGMPIESFLFRPALYKSDQDVESLEGEFGLPGKWALLELWGYVIRSDVWPTFQAKIPLGAFRRTLHIESEEEARRLVDRIAELKPHSVSWEGSLFRFRYPKLYEFVGRYGQRLACEYWRPGRPVVEKELPKTAREFGGWILATPPEVTDSMPTDRREQWEQFGKFWENSGIFPTVPKSLREGLEEKRSGSEESYTPPQITTSREASTPPIGGGDEIQKPKIQTSTFEQEPTHGGAKQEAAYLIRPLENLSGPLNEKLTRQAKELFARLIDRKQADYEAIKLALSRWPFEARNAEFVLARVFEVTQGYNPNK